MVAAMHAQTPVYPTSTVDAYAHNFNYTPAAPTSYEPPYHSSPSQGWPTPETSQPVIYTSVSQCSSLPNPTRTTSPVSSPSNPLTPPQSGSPHSSIYGHEEGPLIHRSPTGSPQSVHETNFQPLTLPPISGTIHLPGKYAYYSTVN